MAPTPFNTQSHDTVSCYRKPVEPTNEIKGRAISLVHSKRLLVVTDRILRLSLKTGRDLYLWAFLFSSSFRGVYVRFTYNYLRSQSLTAARLCWTAAFGEVTIERDRQKDRDRDRNRDRDRQRERERERETDRERQRETERDRGKFLYYSFEQQKTVFPLYQNIWNRFDCRHSGKKIQNTQEVKKSAF